LTRKRENKQGGGTENSKGCGITHLSCLPPRMKGLINNETSLNTDRFERR
jgi:hypothetical protein